MKKVWMGLVACSALGLAAQAQAQERTCAYMFQDVNFGGEVLEVRYNAQNWDMGHWNDRVSSVKVVGEGCVLYVYEDVSFEGEYKALVSEVSDLEAWKNRISSYGCVCT
ncbi:beta/gamma crystallin-related protein [Polyangium jinanense]|uniref:Peptidase inhibitor family I36 protein n=1 Tax=Polyangium jinanense TaxID=2829994 RepID=A0A9X3XG03_9BACT|nr:beta/gamma crystallin-related protein [Polyangium jinanense]MDC3988705.1 peptidase inhibitor family I36 protein [Polyangium jinanense]